MLSRVQSSFQTPGIYLFSCLVLYHHRRVSPGTVGASQDVRPQSATGGVDAAQRPQRRHCIHAVPLAWPGLDGTQPLSIPSPRLLIVFSLVSSSRPRLCHVSTVSMRNCSTVTDYLWLSCFVFAVCFSSFLFKSSRCCLSLLPIVPCPYCRALLCSLRF